MNTLSHIKQQILETIKNLFHLENQQLTPIQINLNVDKEKAFGDFTCNAAMVLAKALKQKPRELAEQICTSLRDSNMGKQIAETEIAGPGFINISLTNETWQQIAQELFEQKENYFHLDASEKTNKYLVEFVSANPTGPLHIGHGRGGIIGDVLANVLNFLGHKADREFYINDAGTQIYLLGRSLKIRCQQELGQKVDFPDDGYAGTYIIDLAKKCIAEHGQDVIEQDNTFFANYAKHYLLDQIRKTLEKYGIVFDEWFSELNLHKSGAIEQAIELLENKNLVYEHDGALWFKATEFGDDKDRIIRKSDGTLTYIAADIAYHKNKFDRGYDILVNTFGQDHHGYVARLKATMNALEFNAENLQVVLFQMVSIKRGEEQVKMSKRSGKFETLKDLIDTVGTDVSRFFYLNRKAEAHLEFDLDVALKKTEENPVYYIQYAYVRTNSLLEKAREHENLKNFLDNIDIKKALSKLSPAEIGVLKKMCSLETVSRLIAESYQTHMLAYYTLELAQAFHNYYAHNKIVDPENVDVSCCRLFMVKLVRQTLATCLNLLGLSKPERM